ncbi:MAG: hypothetical protein KDE28_04020 [Anaerolineales bacterium]|nr:hypothetical protein [Anaerolineales bacterium]
MNSDLSQIFSFHDMLPYFQHVLHDFEIQFWVPMEMVHRGEIISATLNCNARIANTNDWDNDDTLKISVEFAATTLASPGNDQGFEFELWWIQKQLGGDSHLIGCTNCRFSDYPPYFNSAMMGDLVCFVDTEFKNVDSRGKGHECWHQPDSKYVTVQEFHKCAHFERTRYWPWT